LNFKIPPIPVISNKNCILYSAVYFSCVNEIIVQHITYSISVTSFFSFLIYKFTLLEVCTERNCNMLLIIDGLVFNSFCFIFSTVLLYPFLYLSQMFYKALIFPSIWYGGLKAASVQSVKSKCLPSWDFLDCFLFRRGFHKFTYHFVFDHKFVILILLCRSYLSFIFFNYPQGLWMFSLILHYFL
jgi:hypothetical protein